MNQPHRLETEGLEGIGKRSRGRLNAILRGTRDAISVPEAAAILEMSRADAARILARLATNGWISRVRRGLYVEVPPGSWTADVALEQPWIIAHRLFSPCYIGGFSAAEHWHLTDQMFRTIVVMTARRPQDRKPVIKEQRFWLRTVRRQAMFGLEREWCGGMKVPLSDPTRTILDMLNDPLLGGGARSTATMLAEYLRTEMRDLPLLIDYAERLGNGAVFKRLGFFLERIAPDEQETMAACRARLTNGTAKLDSTLPVDRLVTKWRLWVPDGWEDWDLVEGEGF